MIKRLIVMGDSLSATETSWPQYIDREEWVLNLHAQAGRMARDYEIPRDLRPTNAGDTVVYMLGSNDIGHQTVHNGDSRPTEAAMRRHLIDLQGKGLNLLVVIPPVYGFPNMKKSLRIHRNMMKRLARELDIPTFDLQKIWRKNETGDGLHPLPVLSRRISTHIMGLL